MNDILIKHRLKENLKRLREINNFRQEDIANALDIERSTYASWESGRSLPKPVQLAKLSQMFNCSVDFLLFSEKYNEMILRCDPPYRTNQVYGEQYMLELTDEERALLLKFRLLTSNDKAKLDEFIDNIRSEKE